MAGRCRVCKVVCRMPNAVLAGKGRRSFAVRKREGGCIVG